jgi:hypothetical protein
VFERYTEKARRTIFFARYEASQYGSPYIESEHLLLGLLRENRHVAQLLPPGSWETIRKQIDDCSPKRQSVSTSVDLPLSNECKRVLVYAAEEAERLTHKHIGTEHLFLALLREEKCFAAQMLRERGLALHALREQIANSSNRLADTWTCGRAALLIHGSPRNINFIRERVKMVRRSNWYWGQAPFKPRDIVLQRESGKISLDLSLAANTQEFELKAGGYTKDLCLICDWELFESQSEPDHGVAYTNGQKWVCTECYEKFLQGTDYFATGNPDIR